LGFLKESFREHLSHLCSQTVTYMDMPAAGLKRPRGQSAFLDDRTQSVFCDEAAALWTLLGSMRVECS
jgi:hypothetical protein